MARTFTTALIKWNNVGWLTQIQIVSARKYCFVNAIQSKNQHSVQTQLALWLHLPDKQNLLNNPSRESWLKRILTYARKTSRSLRWDRHRICFANDVQLQSPLMTIQSDFVSWRLQSSGCYNQNTQAVWQNPWTDWLHLRQYRDAWELHWTF